MMWMNLEPVIHSEVTEKEKNKYHIYMESRKISRAAIKMQTHRTDLWTQYGGEGGMNGDSSMETYTLPDVK